MDPRGQMWKWKACWVEWRVDPSAAGMGSIGRCTGARSPTSPWAPLSNHPRSPPPGPRGTDGLCTHDSGLSPPVTTKCPARELLHLRPGK